MTTPLPADWYADPFGRHEHRYWDGALWTEHVASGGSQAVDSRVDAAQAATVADLGNARADWYPDPTGRHAVRYWDGTRWTEHVSSRGHQGIDLAEGGAASSTASRPNQKVERQARNVVPDDGRLGGGTLFTEPVLVVNQKVKILGGTRTYGIFDQRGSQVGMVEEVARGIMAKVGDSFNGRTDDTREYKFRIVDMNRQLHLTIRRPAKWWSGKSKMVVEDAAGATIGYIRQETYGVVGEMATLAHTAYQTLPAIAEVGIGLVADATVGKAVADVAGKSVGWVVAKAAGIAATVTGGAILDAIDPTDRLSSLTEGLDKVGHVRFGLEADGMRLGSIQAETTEGWEFRVADPAGTEFARVTKTWGGWSKEHFTKADNYVLQMERPLKDPLLSLVIAAALAVDIALKWGHPASDAAAGQRRR